MDESGAVFLDTSQHSKDKSCVFYFFCSCCPFLSMGANSQVQILSFKIGLKKLRCYFLFPAGFTPQLGIPKTLKVSKSSVQELSLDTTLFRNKQNLIEKTSAVVLNPAAVVLFLGLHISPKVTPKSNQVPIAYSLVPKLSDHISSSFCC